MTAWIYLPNKTHIECILADMSKNVSKWANAWDSTSRRNSSWNTARDAARATVWNEASDAARDDVLIPAWNTALDSIWDATASTWACGGADRYAAWSAIMALIAWDSAGELLVCNPEHVRLLAILGDNRAILMLPAVIAMDVNK